jgi:hypothetical protein
MRFISFSDYLLATDLEKEKYWLVILKEWDKLIIPREEYLGIKWDGVRKPLSCVEISKIELFLANEIGY